MFKLIISLPIILLGLVLICVNVVDSFKDGSEWLNTENEFRPNHNRNYKRKNEANHFSFNGNSMLDDLLKKVQNELKAYDKVILPPFKFYSPMCTVYIPTTTILGLTQIQRIGDVSLKMSSSNSDLNFALNWPHIETDADIFILFLGIAQWPSNYKGHAHLNLDNLTSSQLIDFDNLSQTPSLQEYNFTMGNVALDVTGFGEGAKLGSQAATQFMNQMKDDFLEILSILFKSIFNAAITEVKASLLANGGVVPVPGGAPGIPVISIPKSFEFKSFFSK